MVKQMRGSNLAASGWIQLPGMPRCCEQAFLTVITPSAQAIKHL